MTDHTELIERLQSRTASMYLLEDVNLFHEAADALEAAQAEIEAVRKANIDCVNHFDALRIDYDAALARLAKLEKQEPVAWAMQRADGLVLDVICPEEHESHEGSYTLPLYAAAGACPVQSSQAGELSTEQLLYVQSALKAVKQYGNIFRYERHQVSPYEKIVDALAIVDAAINAKESK